MFSPSMTGEDWTAFKEAAAAFKAWLATQPAKVLDMSQEGQITVYLAEIAVAKAREAR